MAVEPTHPEEMDREELEHAVRALQQRVDELEERVAETEEQPTRTVINHLFASLTGADVDDYQADPFQLQQAAEDMHDRLAALESDVRELKSLAGEEESLTADSTVGNWRRIVQKAHNLRDHRDHGMPNNRVKLFKKQIAGAVGCTERHALNLIDRYTDAEQLDYDGVEKQPYKQYTTSRQTESSGVQEKALIIDLDVWELDDE